MSTLEVVGGVLVVLGGLCAFTGGVGLLRFPDFYTRTHAAGLTDALGAGLILLGLLLHVEDWHAAVRVLAILLFMWLTGPTASHALAQAARNDDLAPWRYQDGRRGSRAGRGAARPGRQRRGQREAR